MVLRSTRTATGRGSGTLYQNEPREAKLVGFAGVRNYNGSCVCISLFARGMGGRSSTTVGLSSERFKINNSNIVCVRGNAGTSFRVIVCGTSNSHNTVYKGNVHYITECICSGKCASGVTFAVRSVNGIGCVALALSRDNTISLVGISVNTPVLTTTRVPILDRRDPMVGGEIRVNNTSFSVAYISVNGPRTITFVSGDPHSFTIRGCNPLFRGGDVFPSQMGTRFTCIVNEARVRVHI